MDAPVDLLGRLPSMVDPDDVSGVLLGLEQARHELHLVGADERRRLLQTEVHLEPVRQEIAVLVPPALDVRPRGEMKELLTRLGVRDAVEGEQVGDVAFLELDPAELQPADLGVRCPDGLASRLSADPVGLAQPTEMGAEDDPPGGGPVLLAWVERTRL